MTGQRRSCVISLLCLFAMYVSAGEDQSLVINADNFLCRLRGNINLCKEYREGKKTREYAYFRLAGKYMKVGDFCKLYQSLCSSSKPGDMVSIITIRSKNVKKSHEPKKYMENFTKAIQEYVNQNDGYVSVGSLSLTVGYFELKSLGDYDLVNEHFSRICNIRRRCEELVIENAHALCFDAFTGIFFSKIEKSILSYRVTRNSLEEENKIFLDIKNGDYKLFDDIKELSLHNCLYGNHLFMNSGKDSAFGRIHSSMCCHEDKLQYEYFTNKQNRFDNFLKLLIKNKYRELFEQIFNDMAASYVPISEMKRNEEAFRNFFVDIYVRHLDNCRVNQTFANDGGYGNQFYHFMKSNNFRAQFRDMFRSFLQYEGSDLLYDTYITKTEKILQEIQSERITTIAYNRQIDSESMYQLCDIIGNRKALDGSYKQQYIYLEDGKAITQEEVKECCDACDKITIESGEKEQLVEFYPIKKGVNEDDVKSRNYTYLRHQAVADYTRGLSYTASPSRSKETVITIDAFDKTGLVVASKKKIKSLIDVCLARDHCKLVNAHVVNVTNEIGTFLIHIVQYEKNDTALKKVLLIYDMPILNDVKNSTDLKYLNRRIIPRENVPDSNLNDLYQYFQFLQLSSFEVFVVPNVRDLDPDTYQKKTPINKYVKINDPCEMFAQNAYINVTLVDSWFTEWTCIRDLEFFHRYCQKCLDHQDLFDFYDLTSARLKPILYQMLISTSDKDDLINDPNTFYKSCRHDIIKMKFNENEDRSFYLHLSEKIERCHSQNLVLNPLNILAKIQTIKEISQTFEILTRIMKFIDHELTFCELIVIDICSQNLHAESQFGFDRPILEMLEFLSIIYKHIEDIFKTAKDIIDSNKLCNGHVFAKNLDLEDMQKSLNAKAIQRLGEVIVQELINLARKDKMMFASLKISKASDGSFSCSNIYVEVKYLEFSVNNF